MKKLIICIVSFVCTLVIHAQNNVGVNTTNPQASLDVRGSQRVGGINSFMHFDSTTGRIQWASAHLYVPVSQQIIRHSASSEGLYAGGGRLEYRNASDPVFFTDWTNGNGYFKNNLGIGSINPYAPLTFTDANGPKISLSGNTTNHHGFGVQDDILQVYSESTPGSSIAFGNLISSNFNETMRINTGTGRVGIGTSTPRGRLHISNGNFGVIPISPAMLVLESNSFAYMNLLSPIAAESGILFGNESGNSNGGIIYGNSGTPYGFQFRNNGNVTKMVLDNLGRLGIGTTTPNAPLTFPPALGKKITLYPGATGDVGLAVQGNLFQVYSDNPNADIAFGFDQGGVMTERMRIKGNGNVGIGTNNPQAKLDVIGDIKFSGGLNLNGNQGLSGQVLQSNGNSTVPTWVSSTNTLFNTTNIVTSVSALTLHDVTPSTQVPGLIYTFATTGNAKVIVSYNIAVNAIACSFCIPSQVYIDIVLDGGPSGQTQNSVANSASVSISNSKLLFVGAGSHTISIFGAIAGPDVRINPGFPLESNLIIQVIPQ